MDIEETNLSLQSVINLSCSETEDKEQLQRFKKTKIARKSKSVQMKTQKKVPRCRVRKVTERLTKTLKRNGRYYPTYEIKRANGINLGDSDQDVSKDGHTASPLLPFKDLLEKHSFKYEVKPGKHVRIDGLFLQDEYMINVFKHYPSYICVDFLCEIMELELNLYLFISVDSNSYCEIIAIGLFRSCEEGLLWMSEVFKKHNTNWRKIKLIMTDKKARCNEVLKGVFPERPILMSSFHSLKSLKKDLSNLDFNITDEDINKVLLIFEQMIFAPDESFYSELLKELKAMSPTINSYFRKAYHQKKEFWALGQQLNSKLFFKSLNVYLNLIRKAIKPLICSLNCIEDVIKILCSIIETKRYERFQNFTSIFSTACVNQKKLFFFKYSKFLTPFATNLVFEQINNSADVKNIRKLECGKYMCSSEHIGTINKCSCNFFQLLDLPCCHIFGIRKLHSLPLYSESLCSSHWISTNYQITFVDLQSIFSVAFIKLNVTNATSKLESFQQYFKICSEMFPLLMECSEQCLQERISILKKFINACSNGIQVSVATDDSQQGTSSNSNTREVQRIDCLKDVHGVPLADILDSDDDIPPLIF